MDCRQVQKKMASDTAERVLQESGDEEIEALERHLQECTACRRQFGHRVDFQSPRRLDAEGKLKTQRPQNSPEPLRPVEFKNLPVRFELHLEDKIEEIKMVEPEVDLPLPEGAELRIVEQGVHLRSVVFRYDADRRFYILEIHRRSGSQDDWRSFTEAFGPDPEPQARVLDSAYGHDIFHRQRLRAWIEMGKGKARIRIRYET